MNSILRKVEVLGLNASAGHTWNSQDAPSTKLNSGKKQAIWRHYPRRWTSWAKSLFARFGGTTTWGNLTTSRLYQKSSGEFGEKICKLKSKITSCYSLEKAPSQRHRNAYVSHRFGSFNAQCWANEIWAQIQWILWESPKLTIFQQQFVFKVKIKGSLQLFQKIEHHQIQ